MSRIPEAEIERLKQSISLADLCRGRGIELKPHGSHDLIGKCPFHEDKNPSFVVTPEKQLFHCMGCDAAGSVIDFVMRADGIEFKEAVARLLTSTRPAAPVSETPRRPSVPPEKANTLLERVLAVYEKTFAEVPEGKAYLEKRGITDAGLFSAYRAGYANGKLKDLLPNGGTVRDDLKAIGILLENGQERFAECVTFPVYATDGSLVTIYGRRIGEPVGQLDSLTVGQSDSRKQNQEPRTKNQEPQTRPRHFYLRTVPPAFGTQQRRKHTAKSCWSNRSLTPCPS